MGSLLAGSRRALLSAPSFDPLSFGSVLAAGNAKKLNLADNAAVDTWLDLSGLANNLAQGTGSKQPTYKLNQINGRPAVSFDGGDSLGASLNFGLSTGATVFLVLTIADDTNTRVLFEMHSNSDSVTDSFILFHETTKKATARLVGDVGTSTFANDTLMGATPMCLVAVYDKSLTSGETKVYVNGVASGTQLVDANNTNGFGNRACTLGSRAGASFFHLGLVGEFVVYKRALSADDAIVLTRYSRAEWGTP